MYDSRAWFPEAHSIFRSSAGQEVVDLVVDFLELDPRWLSMLKNKIIHNILLGD